MQMLRELLDLQNLSYWYWNRYEIMNEKWCPLAREFVELSFDCGPCKLCENKR